MAEDGSASVYLTVYRVLVAQLLLIVTAGKSVGSGKRARIVRAYGGSTHQVATVIAYRLRQRAIAASTTLIGSLHVSGGIQHRVISGWPGGLGLLHLVAGR